MPDGAKTPCLTYAEHDLFTTMLLQTEWKFSCNQMFIAASGLQCLSVLQ